jgi:LAS superfamily LD-carboxypeptidase LdcB
MLDFQNLEDYIERVARSFTGDYSGDSTQDLFSDEEDGEDLLADSFWNEDDQWWFSGSEIADEAGVTVDPQDATTNTKKEQRIAEGMPDPVDPTSPGAFAVAQAQTMPSIGRWFKKHDNGKIDANALVKIDNQGNALRPDAAAAFKSMRRAARKAGVNIVLSGAQSGYRDYDTQVALKASKGNLAATPGTSNHGWGMAIDVGPEARAWIAKHGQKWGFFQLPSESWHFDWKPGHFDGPVNAWNKAPKPKAKRVRKPAQKGQGLRGVAAMEYLATEGSDPLLAVPAGVISAMRDAKRPERPQEARSGHGAADLDFVPKRFRQEILEAAKRHGIDPMLFAPAGAIGLTQIVPSSHPDVDSDRLTTDPRYALNQGARILSHYIKLMGGVKKGLAAYNAGPSGYRNGLGYANELIEEWRR